jgi:N6-adenosine-specific RNA methylase IME4
VTEVKKYKTIYADPPWNQTGGGQSKRGADRHYPLLKEDQIIKVMKDALKDKVEDNAHMYMWVANNHLPEAIRIIEALGFRYVTNLVWSKTAYGLGRYFRGQHELCLFATKGNGISVRTDKNNVPSLVGQSLLPRRRHSQKPDEMYSLIEDRSHGPYLEMFARQKREGWDSWGNDPSILEPQVEDSAEEES